MNDNPPKRNRARDALIVILFLLSTALALGALILPTLRLSFGAPLSVEQVASQDYRASVPRTYTSEVLTQQRREASVRAVQTVYTPVDTSIARQQLERLRAVLAYVTNVRADTHASTSQKLDDLAALEDLRLNQDKAEQILNLSDARWQSLQGEAITLLEKTMTSAIKPGDLAETRDRLPRLVSLSLPEEQVTLVVELVSPFITANSQPSESLTEAARQQALEAVEPVQRSFAIGQTIVQRGQVLSEADIEALQQFGLVQSRLNWQELVGAAALALLMVVFIAFYLYRRPNLVMGGMRNLVLISALMLLFLITARVTIPYHTIIPYAFPLMAFGLIVAALFGAQSAIIFSIPLAVLAAYNLPNSLDLTLYYLFGSLFGILVLGQARRLANFFWAGLAVAVAGSVVIIAYRLLLPSTDAAGLATLTGAAFFNGLATASLAILLQFFLAAPLKATTPIQLIDLTRPDHPLLQFILREAPGTYQHSLQLANLAEQAAEKIGADPLLTRVGALYHDAGKTLNPGLFIENQAPGFPNPHESMDPITSATTIIKHVSDGLELGHKFRLPRRILDFIAEHHGTLIARYQYVRAVKAAGGDESKVDKELFRYPGPKPHSLETAILMLADGCEARVRAEMPQGEEELRKLIKQVIDERVAAGQMDNTRLTLRDLEIIRESFIATLRGMYHPRVLYPSLEPATGQPAEQAEACETTRPLNGAPIAANNLEPPTIPRLEKSKSSP
jgi:hypothetical protein